MTATRATELPFTGDPEADALLATEPMALLIGFVLDQQVTVQKAFAAPLELLRRIRTLDAAVVTAMDSGDLEHASRAQPALRRFPGNMAKRTQALCAEIADTYARDASGVWTDAADGPDLEARPLALLGIRDMKVKALLAILGRRFGVALPGIGSVMSDYPHSLMSIRPGRSPTTRRRNAPTDRSSRPRAAPSTQKAAGRSKGPA